MSIMWQDFFSVSDAASSSSIVDTDWLDCSVVDAVSVFAIVVVMLTSVVAIARLGLVGSEVPAAGTLGFCAVRTSSTDGWTISFL